MQDTRRNNLARVVQANSCVASAAAPKVKGSRFSDLPDDDDGSTIPSSTKLKFAVPLKPAKLAGLAKENRKAEVDKIKKDIGKMGSEEKEKSEK